MRTWTEAQTEQVIRLWKSGLSAAEIALTMGKTRNAICGKVDRLGLLAKTPQQKQARISAQWLIRKLKRRSFKAVPDDS